jgi:psiF repeat
MNAPLSIVAAAVCVALLALSVGFADIPPPGDAAAGAAATPAPPPSSDAAKHAKRTACLKDAKAKKLVGPEKTSFIKSCIAAP